MFLRSISLLGIKSRAKLVWMKELGYDERDAITFAEYQTRAIICAFIGFFYIGPDCCEFCRTLKSRITVIPLPGIGMTIIDGTVRTQRSRNTPPATRLPEIVVGHWTLTHRA